MLQNLHVIQNLHEIWTWFIMSVGLHGLHGADFLGVLPRVLNISYVQDAPGTSLAFQGCEGLSASWMKEFEVSPTAAEHRIVTIKFCQICVYIYILYIYIYPLSAHSC